MRSHSLGNFSSRRKRSPSPKNSPRSSRKGLREELLELTSSGNSPRNNSPRNNSPRNNSPRNNSPRNNSPRNNSPRNNSPRKHSPRFNNSGPQKHSPRFNNSGDNSPRKHGSENNSPRSPKIPKKTKPKTPRTQKYNRLKKQKSKRSILKDNISEIKASNNINQDRNLKNGFVKKNTLEIKSPRETQRSGNLNKIYKIRDIDKGGSGAIVYEAKMGKFTCCVKELLIDKSTNEQDIKQFQKEILLLSSIPQRSHIVDYIGYNQTANKIQIIMGYYNGTLYDLIKKQRSKKRDFTVTQITHISTHILRGLKILHDRNLIHRDLKSTNIFYEGDPRKLQHIYFVIGDLGESKIIKRQQQAKSIKGTPAWIAPEVFKGKGEIPYTLTADIWSFGMVLYELITLKFPYYQYKFVASIIEAGEKPLISHDKQHLYKILIPLWTKCTHVEPEKRITASHALNNILQL